jgi:hypothetical protein
MDNRHCRPERMSPLGLGLALMFIASTAAAALRAGPSARSVVQCGAVGRFPIQDEMKR